RENALGIMTQDDTQIVFYDTPGIINPKFKRLLHMNEDLVNMAWDAIKDVDVVLLLIDATKDLEVLKHILLSFQQIRKDIPKTRFIGGINKMDLLTHKQLSELCIKVGELDLFEEVFVFSAMKQRGLEDLKIYLFNIAKPGEWLYD